MGFVLLCVIEIEMIDDVKTRLKQHGLMYSCLTNFQPNCLYI